MNSTDDSDAYKVRAKMFIRLAIDRGWSVLSISDFGVSLKRGKKMKWKDLVSHYIAVFLMTYLFQQIIQSDYRPGVILTPIFGVIAVLILAGMIHAWFFEEEARFLFRADILDDAKSIDEMLR